MKAKPRSEPTLPEITWSHAGVFRRVTAWPEAGIERLEGESWTADQPNEGAFAAAAVDVTDTAWLRYLEFVPREERQFLAQFRFSRMEALQVIACCPELLPVLSETPALTAFVSAQVAVRGNARAAWDELSAIFDRSGVFGVLEWLGLPATRAALTAMRNFADPEIPRRFIAPVRALLWNGVTAATLEHTVIVTDVDLARTCHRLAA